VKIEDRYSCSLLLLFVLCPPALPQTVTVFRDGTKASANIAWTTEPETVAPVQLTSDGEALSPPPQTAGTPAEKPYGWHIAIYPALAWAPIFGTSVTLPGQPSPSGSTSSSLNGLFAAGARFEKGKWSADTMFMWAALSAQRQNPLVDVNLDLVLGDAMGGRTILPNLYVEGGVRSLALDIHATVGSSSASRSPRYWDPLIGLTYRRELGRKWRILVHGDGGGFGVGSDVDISATARAEWQFARHFGIAMGYGGMHLSDSNTVDGKTLKISPTLHGPTFGFGIFF
jgi:hypothetical protein